MDIDIDADAERTKNSQHLGVCFYGSLHVGMLKRNDRLVCLGFNSGSIFFRCNMAAFLAPSFCILKGKTWTPSDQNTCLNRTYYIRLLMCILYRRKTNSRTSSGSLLIYLLPSEMPGRYEKIDIAQAYVRSRLRFHTGILTSLWESLVQQQQHRPSQGSHCLYWLMCWM